ncbi:MAG TPA: PGPGW domain-containing protein, partial [Thermoanaerobaculia bacterium]|nr:PGPGW domain-containing protein [Thermoanaerobaculia bacterium]
GPHPPFPVWLRAGLMVCAVLLVIVGVAGLFLPGLQGIVTILAGVALLSLVSDAADRFLRWSLKPWPKLLGKVEELRDRSRDWLAERAERIAHRKAARRGETGGAPAEAAPAAAAPPSTALLTPLPAPLSAPPPAPVPAPPPAAAPRSARSRGRSRRRRSAAAG